LTKENAQLKAQLDQMQNQMSQLIAMQMGQQQQMQNRAQGTPQPAPQMRIAGPTPTVNPSQTGAPVASQPTVAQANVARPTVGRTHTVRSGDTFYKIAKQYRVSEAALKTANPRVDARRMQIGQVIQVPSL
jgi:LysM repeat protein